MKSMIIKKVFLLLVCFGFVGVEARKKRSNNILEISLDMPDSFGKTHFIVGMPPGMHKSKSEPVSQQTDDTDSINTLICNGRVKQVYFSPDDNIKQVLLHLISKECSGIQITAFNFTSGDIARALVEAAKRGVAIEIIFDPGCVKDKFSKVSLLEHAHIALFVYNPEYAGDNGLITSLMHNKILLFKKNILQKPLVVTGSLNLTKSALTKNQENILVSDDEFFIEKYTKQYEVIKKRCRTLSKHMKVVSRVPYAYA